MLDDKTRQNFVYAVKEYVDCDYLDKLSPEEKQWHRIFMEEEYNGHPMPGATKEAAARSYNKKYLARSDIYTLWNRDESDDLVENFERFAGKIRGRCTSIAVVLMKALSGSTVEEIERLKNRRRMTDGKGKDTETDRQAS